MEQSLYGQNEDKYGKTDKVDKNDERHQKDENVEKFYAPNMQQSSKHKMPLLEKISGSNPGSRQKSCQE